MLLARCLCVPVSLLRATAARMWLSRKCASSSLTTVWDDDDLGLRVITALHEDVNSVESDTDAQHARFHQEPERLSQRLQNVGRGHEVTVG